MAIRYGMAINTKRCIGCRTCAVSCKMENTVPVGAFRVKVLNSKGTLEGDAYEGVFPNVSMVFTTSMCQHCTTPACNEVCPTGAAQQREDGIVFIDQDMCIGCRTCESACPYDARSLNKDTGTEIKCTMCMHRLDEGLTPMCSFCCPVQAITIGDLNDTNSELSKKIKAAETTQRLIEKGTEPNTYYI